MAVLKQDKANGYAMFGSGNMLKLRAYNMLFAKLESLSKVNLDSTQKQHTNNKNK